MGKVFFARTQPFSKAENRTQDILISEKCPLFTQIHVLLCFQAVKHLHDNNLVHVDIKPDNIFLSYDGVCKLGDFGLVIDLTKVCINMYLVCFEIYLNKICFTCLEIGMSLAYRSEGQCSTRCVTWTSLKQVAFFHSRPLWLM